MARRTGVPTEGDSVVGNLLVTLGRCHGQFWSSTLGCVGPVGRQQARVVYVVILHMAGLQLADGQDGEKVLEQAEGTQLSRRGRTMTQLGVKGTLWGFGGSMELKILDCSERGF